MSGRQQTPPGAAPWTRLWTRTLWNRLYHWDLFPGFLQVPMVGVAAAATFLSVWPPRHSEMNVGAAVVWQLWWALLPFVTLVVARSWCAVCPFPMLGDLAQRLRRSLPPPPPPRLRRAGPWLATVTLGLLGFVFLLTSLERNGALTASLLAGFTLAAVATGLTWRGRAWCRYLCPVGLLLGLYSRLAWLRLEPLGERGRRAAADGAKLCPLFTSTLSPQHAQDCVLCAACLRVPGSDAVVAQGGRPSLASQTLRHAESAAVSLLMGLLLVDALRMTPLYSGYMARAVPALGGRYELAMGLGIASTVVAAVLVQVGLATHGDKKEGFGTRFGRLSMVLLPLVLATQLALSAQHLMSTGDVLRNLVAELGLLEPGHMPPTDAYIFLWPMKLLQWGMLVTAIGVSLRSLRLGGSHHPNPLPSGEGASRATAGTTVLLGLVLLAIFAQPMSVAC